MGTDGPAATLTSSSSSQETSSRWSVLRAYGNALLVTGVAIGLRVAFDPILGSGRVPYLTLVFAQVLVGWRWGLGPSMLSVLVGLLGVCYWVIPPVNSMAIAPVHMAGAIGYLIVGTACGLLGKQIQVATRREQRYRDRLELVLGSMSDAYYTLDSQWRYTYLNSQAVLRTGRNDLVGKRIWDEYPQLVGTSAEEQMRRAMRERISCEYELFYSPSGRWYRHRLSPCLDGGLAISSQDITEAKRADEDLRAYQSRLKLLSDTVPALISYVSHQRNYVSCNQAYATWFGMSCEDIQGKHMSELLGEKAWEIVGPQMDRAFAGETVDFEAEALYKHGGPRWIHAVYTPHRDELGSVLGVIVLVMDITAKKTIELKTSKEQQTLVDLIDRAPFGIYIVNHELRITQMNAGSRQGAFQNVSPVIGHDLAEAMHILWPPVLAEFVVGKFRQTLATGEAFISKDFIGPRQDTGELESYEWELHRIRLPDGEPGVVCFFYDSTRLRQVELALRDSESHLRLILDSARDFAIITLDTEGVIIDWNKGAERLLGYTPEEAIGQPGHLIFTPEDIEHQVPQKELQTAMTQGRAFNERWHKRRDGSQFWGSGLVSTLQREGQTPRGFVKIMRDITEAVIAQQKLEQRELLFRTLGEASPMIISLADRVGRIEYVSPRWREFSGRPAEDFITGRWAESIHPDDREAIIAAWQAALRSLEPYEYEFRALGADGEYHWLLARGRPVFDSLGNVTHWVNCAIDIDDRKNYEQALRIADQRKDEFLATLSHELRNPLAPISSVVQVLGRRDLAEHDRTRALEVMQRQVGHLVHLVDDLLEVSRISRGKVELRRSLIELASVVQTAVESTQSQIEASGNSLRVDLPSDPVYLDADPVRLTQVFINLLSNAAKYSDPGGQISVSAHREGGQAVIDVKDTGTGIPADMLPKIFELFTQVDRHLGRAQGGLGIGLSLVKSLVELHGGTVVAASEGLNRGTQFTITLPVATGPTAAAEVALKPAETSVPAAPRETIPGSNNHSPTMLPDRHASSFSSPQKALSVLVVDDNRPAADMLSMLLRLQGAKVLTAYRGPEALEIVSSQHPSVVFLDLGMPEMDGYDVARTIRKDSALPQPTLIALTGWGQEDHRARTRAVGFDYHLTKPASAEQISQLLQELASGAEVG